MLGNLGRYLQGSEMLSYRDSEPVESPTGRHLLGLGSPGVC